MNDEALALSIRASLPGVLAVYLFGSRATANANPGSDLDLAVLVEGQVDPLFLWSLAGDLADSVGCPVDLVDLRAASTVMQYQVITNGRRIWHSDARAGIYEAFILSEKTELDSARAALIADIERDGKIHAR